MIFLLLNLVMIGLPLNDKKKAICLYTNEAVKIDARVNEWNHANSLQIRDETQRTHNSASLKTMWDDQYLYLLFEVQDKNLEAKQTLLDHPELYLDDMVEFLIDTRNEKDSCWNEDDVIYHINLLGQKKDDRGSIYCITNASWNGNAEYAINILGTLNNPTDVDAGYVIEVKISWQELGVQPVMDLRMGFNFAVGDSGKLFDWVDASPFRSPYAFGDLILAKEKK